MGAYSKPTLLADVFINHFATKNTVLFVILPEQPYLKETKKKDATLGDIPLWESNTYLKFKLYLLSSSAFLVSGALGP